MKKISLLLLASLLVTGQAFANTGTTSTGVNLLSDLNTLIAQYETQLKYLQAENAVLRNEVSKAGIKIPLSEFSGSVLSTTQTTNTGNTASNTEAKAPVKKTVSGEMEIALSKIEKEHGKRYRGFIAGILPNWTAIKAAYKLPADADILGYEFVQKGDNDHVFVDISFGGRTASATGVYDAKILYQYHTKTFARKLVGLFIYDTKAKYYVTKTGNNPFA